MTEVADDSAFHDIEIDTVSRHGAGAYDGIDTVTEAVEHRKMAFKKLSIVHLVAGIAAISLASASVAVRGSDPTYNSYGFTTIAPGIWCGVVYLISSFFTHFVSSRKVPGAVTIAWCVSACSTAFACTMFCIDLSTCIILLSDRNCCVNTKTALVLIHLALSVVACLEVVVSTVTCGFCCRVYCCLAEPPIHYKAAIYSVFKGPHKMRPLENETSTNDVTRQERPITSTSSFQLPNSP